VNLVLLTLELLEKSIWKKNKMFKFFTRKKKYLSMAILEIGSSKVICTVVSKDIKGDLKVLGIGYQESAGYRGGIITDIEKLEESIINAVDMAERAADENIDEVVLTLSSTKFMSHRIHSGIKIAHRKIEESDIKSILNNMLENVDENIHDILHYFPVEYNVDNYPGIKNPLGIIADKVMSDIHLITAPTAFMKNLDHCFSNCQLRIKDILIGPYASSLSTLTQSEIDYGATLIDIGSSCTSIAAFSEGTLAFTASLPLGGASITSDISKVLSIKFQEAERLKIIHGCALVTNNDQNKHINLARFLNRSDDELGDKNISMMLLNQIIAARIEEIFSYIKKLFIEKKLDPVALSRIVITGGSSSLMGLKEAATKHFNSKVRIATPEPINGIDLEKYDMAKLAGVLGALKYITDESIRPYHQKTELTI